MKQNKSYEIFLETLLQRFPDKKSLANRLVEILHIEKEVAYRRLRGKVPFSFTEITTLALHFDISLDSIMALGTNTLKTRPLRLTTIDYLEPENAEYHMLENFLEDMKQLATYPDSEYICIANTIPQPLYTKYLSIYRFYLLKWKYEDGKTHIRKPFKEICPSEKLLAINEQYRKYILGANHISIIWDKNTLQMFEEDIRYFHDIHLLSKDDIQEIKNEISEMLDELEALTIQGSFANRKNVRFYVSNISIKGTYNIMALNPNYKLCMIKWFTINDTIATDEMTYQQMKDWMYSLQRTSTLITESGEIQRIRFFNQQRKILSLLDNI